MARKPKGQAQSVTKSGLVLTKRSTGDTFRAVARPNRHPIYDAVFDDWWVQKGLDPAWVRKMVEGEVPTSRALAQSALEKWGIPLTSWESLEPEFWLTPDANSTAVSDMSAISSPELAQGLSRSRSRNHPFVRALYNHPDPKKRTSVKTWAEQNGFKVPTVASWFAKGKGARRIPLKAAQLIEKQLGVPATLAVWRNGITTSDKDR